MATASNEIEDIRRKMARIRRELHEDVRDVVEGAEAVSDWRHYVGLYPWPTVGLACAIGFFLVPKRKKHTAKPAEVARAVVAAIPQMASAAPPPPEKKGGWIRAGLGLLAPIALRAGQNYATHFVTNWIAGQQDQVAAMMAAAGMVPEPEPARPGGPVPGFRMPDDSPRPSQSDRR